MSDGSLDAAPADGGTHGLRHRHGREAASTVGELRRAQRSMHWDTNISRVLYVEYCDICREHDRQSVKECTEQDCTEHRICEERFR